MLIDSTLTIAPHTATAHSGRIEYEPHAVFQIAPRPENLADENPEATHATAKIEKIHSGLERYKIGSNAVGSDEQIGKTPDLEMYVLLYGVVGTHERALLRSAILSSERLRS